MSLLVGACAQPTVRAAIYYDLSGLPEERDTHYQQFAQVDGYAVDIGCFFVATRQVNCFDGNPSGNPNLLPAVVECVCPCDGADVPDPCNEVNGTDNLVRPGIVRGTLGHTVPPLRVGGAEFLTEVELEDATELFITVEENTDMDPRPSASLMLRGELVTEGTVLRGYLEPATAIPVSGQVTIVPVGDGASL